MEKHKPAASILEDVDQLNAVMEVAGIGVWDFRPQTDDLFMDDRCFTMAGYAPGELPATLDTLQKLMHPDDRAKIKQQTDVLFSGQCQATQFKYRFRKKDGEWMWVLAKGRIIERDGNGAPVRIAGAHMDIDAWMKAETEKQKYRKRFQHLVENAHMGIFIADDGLIRYANAGVGRITGYSREALIGMPFIDLIHDADKQIVANRHRRRLKGEASPLSYTVRSLNQAGKEIWIELNAMMLEWDERPAVLVFLRDVTLEKSLEKQHLHTQKLQAIGTLASGIAHDFNNILSSVIGYTEIALDDELPPDTPAKQSLENVLKAGARAKELVKQILTFSRQTEYRKESIDIAPIIKEVLKLIRASLPSNIEIRENISNEHYEIFGDPGQIHQTVLNLCINAGYAMREKGGVLCVGITKIRYNHLDPQCPMDLAPGAYVALTVSDTGIGMPLAVMDKIFDPFFTTKAKSDGTGLGLSMVHGIVKAHEGAIWFDSLPGAGTTFRVFFPLIVAKHGDHVIHSGPDHA